jgi:hypothetical protein
MEYGSCIVPGLLQTEEYARRRIMSAPRRPGKADPEAEVATRMARQAVLTREPDAPAYEVIVEENALLGRGTAGVLRDQIARLASASLLPNVTVRVLRREAVVGPHYLPYTGFSLYTISLTLMIQRPSRSRRSPVSWY